MASSNSIKTSALTIYCRSEKRTLQGKNYDSINDFKKDVFVLYPEGNFDDENAIITYFDENKTEQLLNTIPDSSKKTSFKELFIRFVNLGCALCSNPFGLVDDQLIFQCTDVKCVEQYCNNCVQVIQGSSPNKRPFVCMGCQKEVTPTRNMLIEEHIIWKNMCKTYGIQDVLDLKNDYRNHFHYLIRKNIQLRLIHLKSRYQTLRSLLDTHTNEKIEQNSKDQLLINDVNNLCIQLENLIEQLKQTEEEIEYRATMVDTCLDKYKKSMKNFDHLCNISTENVILQEPVVTANTIDTSTIENQQNSQDDFRMNRLNTLSSEQTISAVKDILEDIDFREHCLLNSKQNRLSSQNSLSNDDLDEIEKKLQKISDIKEELKCLYKNLQALKDYTNQYERLLRDEQFSDIACSKFILLLEKMRVRTEEFEISKNFSKTDSLMRTWKKDHSTDDEFKPKVIKLCQALDIDIQNLFQNFNWIYSLSYKIGVIGHENVGKSALVVNLAEMKEYSGMIDFERSTFGYLQFDTLIYKDPDNDRIIPITFIDIEGASETDRSGSIGSYLELIEKADCDLYIIVFDKLFSKNNRIYQEYIENDLQRKCLLVRSKADLLFNQCFRESYGKNYGITHSKEYRKKVVFNQIKNHALKTFDDQRLNKTVYLTAVICEDNLKDTSFAEFDLKALKKKLIQLAKTDVRTERICYLGISTAINVINTCFRRGYVVSQTKYKWLSVGATVIPFLNEVPAFYGREKIRQIFGIHDNSMLTNFLNRTKHTFEYYLLQRKVTVPKDKLKSGEFEYLIAKTSTDVSSNIDISVKNKTTSDQKQKTTRIERTLENMTKPIGATSIGLRTASVVGVATGLLIRPLAAAWSFRSTGQRMNAELHAICDDLAVIFQYFIINRAEEYCPKVQSSLHVSSTDESSSSSDSDDDYFST